MLSPLDENILKKQNAGFWTRPATPGILIPDYNRGTYVPPAGRLLRTPYPQNLDPHGNDLPRSVICQVSPCTLSMAGEPAQERVGLGH